MISFPPKNELVDHKGRPLNGTMRTRRQLAARYDAAQTSNNNERHWQNADNLDPHGANSLEVRRKLRSRSRYEVIENNPYLKGIVQTVANDFVGSGPKLQITDALMDATARTTIEQDFAKWARVTKLRQKLWRIRHAKLVDGEGFMRRFLNKKLRDTGLPQQDWQIIECDRISHWDFLGKSKDNRFYEVDGIKFDKYDEPQEYHILDQHPGGSPIWAYLGLGAEGKWVRAENIIHWFRKERPWMRGIPELTSSLPLCSILRRYTLAVLRNKEIAADFAAIIETDGPANTQMWTDENGDLYDNYVLDTFPIEMGMVTAMPWGYRLNQLNPVPDGSSYNEFVSAILREIVRPLLVPFNLSSGSSQDSNMSAGTLDVTLYRGAQQSERMHAEEEVLWKLFTSWWQEYSLMKSFPKELPSHTWRWDRVGLDHTDPSKVATALTTLLKSGIYTDRDIQEIFMNRSVEEWQEDLRAQQEFREEMEFPVDPSLVKQEPPQGGFDNTSIDGE